MLARLADSAADGYAQLENDSLRRQIAALESELAAVRVYDPVENLRGKANCRRGVALRGLGQDLPLGDFRKLPNDLVPQMVIG